MSDWTPHDFAEQIGAFRREMTGKVRRFLVSFTSDVLWQLTGHALLDPTKVETRTVEVFPGIGFYSRPPDGSTSAEAIVTNVGGSNTPAVVATRDEATRAASAGDLEADSAAMFNTLARVHVRADGVIELHPVGAALTPLNGVVNGEGIDSFTGLTYFALGNASTHVLVKK